MNVSGVTLKWVETSTWRLIPSRYPPVDVLERVASPAEFEILFEIEAMTNNRLRDAMGDIALVPESDRLVGQGTSQIMAPFTHPPAMGQGGRFNPDFGVFYCAREFKTALEETRYHRLKFFLDFNSDPTRFDMRELVTDLHQELHTIAGRQDELTDIYAPDDYSAGQALGRKLKAAQSWGLEYDSVRAPGTCYAVFRPPALSNCRQGRHFEYHFDGKIISHIIQKTEIE